MTSSEIVDSTTNNNELVFTPYEGPLLKLYQQDVHCNICDCKIRLKGVRAHLRTEKHFINTEKHLINTEKHITNTEKHITNTDREADIVGEAKTKKPTEVSIINKGYKPDLKKWKRISDAEDTDDEEEVCKNIYECPICYKTLTEYNTVLSKCGHRHCTKCEKKIDDCSLCRKPLRDKIRDNKIRRHPFFFLHSGEEPIEIGFVEIGGVMYPITVS